MYAPGNTIVYTTKEEGYMTAISEKRMKEAQHCLDDAEFIYSANIGNLQLLTKLYHAMLYSLFALYEIEDIGVLTHADLIKKFIREFVQNNVFSTTYSDALTLAYDTIHECDCAQQKQPDNSVIDSIFPVAQDFVKSIDYHIRTRT